MINAPTLQNIIDSRWCPDVSFLPQKRDPENCGNSPLPYRLDYHNRLSSRIQSIQESENQTAISRWSNLYQFEVPLTERDPLLNGGTILHLSDIHFRKDNPRTLLEVQKLIDYLKNNSLNPDVIVLTGDVITKLPDDLCPCALRALDELGELTKQRLFVFGNHDYHGKVPDYIAAQLEKVGFINLTGSYINVNIGRSQVHFYGIDDAYFGQPKAPKSMSFSNTNIALVHNLDAIRRDFPGETDLILSGHTHWGEVKIPFSNLLKPFDGAWWMGRWGYCDNVNSHTRHWDQLTERTLSFVHPGLARHYAPRSFSHPPGFVLLKITDKARSDTLNISGEAA